MNQAIKIIEDILGNFLAQKDKGNLDYCLGYMDALVFAQSQLAAVEMRAAPEKYKLIATREGVVVLTAISDNLEDLYGVLQLRRAHFKLTQGETVLVEGDEWLVLPYLLQAPAHRLTVADLYEVEKLVHSVNVSLKGGHIIQLIHVDLDILDLEISKSDGTILFTQRFDSSKQGLELLKLLRFANNTHDACAFFMSLC